MDNDQRGKRLADLQRYEALRREHLGTVINLVFALAVAALGYCGSQLAGKESAFSKAEFPWLISSAASFVVTVLVSILATWSRLQDFRLTAQRIRRELRGASDTDLKPLD